MSKFLNAALGNIYVILETLKSLIDFIYLSKTKHTSKISLRNIESFAHYNESAET